MKFIYSHCLISFNISSENSLGNDHNKPHSLMSDPISTMYFHNMSCDLLNKILFKPSENDDFGFNSIQTRGPEGPETLT